MWRWYLSHAYERLSFPSPAAFGTAAREVAAQVVGTFDAATASLASATA